MLKIQVDNESYVFQERWTEIYLKDEKRN